MSARELSIAIDRKRENLQRRIDDAQRQLSSARSELLSQYSNASSAPELITQGEAGEKASELAIVRSMASLEQASTLRPSDRSLQLYELEYSKKFAIPAAGFFFSLLAFPLGLGTKRSGRTAGFGIALILSTLYWGLLFAGQTLGLRSQVSPSIAMWAPNALVLCTLSIMAPVRVGSGESCNRRARTRKLQAGFLPPATLARQSKNGFSLQALIFCRPLLLADLTSIWRLRRLKPFFSILLVGRGYQLCGGTTRWPISSR